MLWELDHKQGCTTKNWWFWTVVLEKTFESPLDSTEITPVNPKGNQFWIFIGRTDAEAEALILSPLDGKNWLIGKVPDAGKDWRQEERDDWGWDGWMASPTEWTWVWVSSRRSLACCSPWGRKQLDMTEQLNWTELKFKKSLTIHLFQFFIILFIVFFYFLTGSRLWIVSDIGSWKMFFQHSCFFSIMCPEFARFWMNEKSGILKSVCGVIGQRWFSVGAKAR